MSISASRIDLPGMEERRMLSDTPSRTRAIARELLAHHSAPTVVFALFGDLGSGKTCFVQGLAEALGITRPVTSPTYTIAHEYLGTCPLYHIDLYRLRGPEDVLATGFMEYIESEGVTAVEWAERADGLLPPGTVNVRFETGKEQDRRIIRVSGTRIPTPERPGSRGNSARMPVR